MRTNEILSLRFPIGIKPELVASGRLAEAYRLTELMANRKTGFSFVRLGDKDVAFLIDPEGTESAFVDVPQRIEGTEPHGTPGLLATQLERLRASLEKASYVDYWDLQWQDGRVLELMNLERPAHLHRNPTRETSFILPTWLEYEFQNYCKGRRVLFCGAEAPLLEILSGKSEFREAAAQFWPADAEVFFLRPKDDGKNPGANLDAIKQAIKAEIISKKIDVLFLSLGGPAKIICQELAEDLGICAIDFGVGMRSMTYSGSGGYTAARATHLIFMYKLPFELYMDSLHQAFPTLRPEEILAKAHAQLILEVQHKEVGWTHGARELEFSDQNVESFKRAFKIYKRKYRYLFKISSITKKERIKFLHFCGIHNLTFEGQLFYIYFSLKSWVKNQFFGLAGKSN